MLILTRGINEDIAVGSDIVITVLGIQRGQVRIGVSAPRDVPVHRREVYERIEAERSGFPSQGNSGSAPGKFAR